MASPLRSFSVTAGSDIPECMICSEWFDDKDADLIPRNLACGHSLCSKCIARCTTLSGSVVRGGISITCPSKCTQQTMVPEGNVQNLPKNFSVLDIVHSTRERSHSLVSGLGRPRSPSLSGSPANSFLTGSGEYFCDVCETSGAVIVCSSCSVFLCHTCSDDIHSRKGYQVHVLTPVQEFVDQSLETMVSDTQPVSQSSELDSSLSEQNTCAVHQGEPLDYYCELCCEEVCRLCQAGSEHRDHLQECHPVADVASKRREILRRMFDAVGKCREEWNKGFDECHERRERLFDRQRDLESAIQSHFHGIHSALHAKEESTLSIIRSEVSARSQLLKNQADQLAKVCAVAKDLTEDCEDLMSGSNSEIIRNADHLLVQAQQYIRSEQDINPVVTHTIEADFSCEDELMKCVERLGQLKMAPGRVLDLQVTASGFNELTLSWKPPAQASSGSTVSINSYIAESVSGNGQYKTVYEGPANECVVEGCPTEDTVHKFRVAAVNDVGRGPYCTPVAHTQRKARFLWDANLKHPKARISGNGYTVSIGENATWVSVGTNVVLSHGQHYWEVVLERYGSSSVSRKVVIGVVNSALHHRWRRSHGVIGIKTCPIGHRSWGLACGTAKKLSSGSFFLGSIGGRHNLFKEGDSVGVLLDLGAHTMSFYKNGQALGIQFNDVYGPVIPAISFCRNKTLTLRFPPVPEGGSQSPTSGSSTLAIPNRQHLSRSRSPSPSNKGKWQKPRSRSGSPNRPARKAKSRSVSLDSTGDPKSV